MFHVLHESYTQIILICWAFTRRGIVTLDGVVTYALPEHFPAGQTWLFRKVSTGLWFERNQPNNGVCCVRQAERRTDTAVAILVCLYNICPVGACQ
jgi:hypothetical protein